MSLAFPGKGWTAEASGKWRPWLESTRYLKILDAEKLGEGSSVAAKAASLFLGETSLFALLSLFHVSCEHKPLVSVVVLEECLCIYFKCVYP